MRQWNCRLVERNGEPIGLEWVTVSAQGQSRAAAAYCDDHRVWNNVSWSEDDEAIVEVEEFGGESGVQRIVIRAYTTLNFSATPEGEV